MSDTTPRVIRLRKPEPKPDAAPSRDGSIYLDKPWWEILAAWDEALRARQAEMARGLVECGWNADAAGYLAYERISTELFEARAQRIAKGKTR